MGDTSIESSSVSKPSSSANPSETSPSSAPTKRKVLKRVRKNRDKPEDPGVDSTDKTAAAIVSVNLGANVWDTLTSSRLYFLLILLRFLLIFITPAVLEGTEFSDGVDVLASALLPGMSIGGTDPHLTIPPHGLGETNQTRSIVGAFITSGIPFMGVNIWCSKVASICTPDFVGLLALYVPRVWMFFVSLISDVLLARCFAVYEGRNAQYAMLTYASMWTTLLAMPRNTNFSLEAMCVVALIAACFGWKPNVARPVFWLSASALSLGIFLRPPFAFFVATPIIYLSSLWDKSGIQPLRYFRAALEGAAIFAFWCSIWVSIDSIYFGTFKIRSGDTVMESFDMFLDYLTSGQSFSYKGSLVYTPINALKAVASREYLTTIALRASPGQMFLSLPAILGPLFIVLLRESYDGMKVAMKEMMTELKQVTNSKKAKKRKVKKAGMTKDVEDELYVYFDTIQTTLLLGLLIEVLQNHDRLGIISLLSLMPPAVVCIAGRVFGPEAFSRFRAFHIVFAVGMVVFHGFLNHSGIPRALLSVGTGGMHNVPAGSGLVVYRGVVGSRSLLGANVKNITVYDGGESKLGLLTKIRELKAMDDYDENNIFVLAAATIPLKEEEFEMIETVAYGHMSAIDMPNNIDDAVRKSSLKMYRFLGDENEAIMQDDEEAAEEEEREQEEKMRKRRKGRDSPGMDEL